MLASRRRFLSTVIAAPLAASSATKHFSRLDFLAGDDLQARLAADPLRPQCHLLPAKNWMNDPNGPIYWKGQYHMFFQYNPGAAVWGDMHWAHAVSPDMIHWRHLPVALAPTPGWDDADGCFTGSAVDNHGTATVIYTGVKSSSAEMATLRDGAHNFREVQCLATSADPQLRTWTKWKTPIIQPPADPMLTGFRDPFLWRDGNMWYLGVGSGVRKQGGRVLLYRSTNLRDWEYLHPLASGRWTERDNINPVDSGEMWECPDFFALGAKHVLLYSTAGKVAWEVGDLDPKELVFHPQRSGVLDHGAYYAQKTQLDADGNRILWGWIPEKRPEAEFSGAGWAGCMALPRLLALSAENDLEMRIAPVAESLRGKAFAPIAPDTSPAERNRRLERIAVESIAGEFSWKCTTGSFAVAIVDDAGPWWSLKMETSGSSTALQINEARLEVPVSASQTMEFHLFLDASVAEFFCDHQHVRTSRIYRKPAGQLRLRLEPSGLASLNSLQAWPLRAISTDRLTT
jgi:beta-fructofuranosidase